MRNVVLFMHISLDGFAAGPDGELDWMSYDEELEKYAEGVVSTVGTALYGRVTYHMMESYWPTVPADPSSTKHALEPEQRPYGLDAGFRDPSGNEFRMVQTS